MHIIKISYKFNFFLFSFFEKPSICMLFTLVYLSIANNFGLHLLFCGIPEKKKVLGCDSTNHHATIPPTLQSDEAAVCTNTHTQVGQ